MKRTDVIIIGAGQCGLAMSAELSMASIDHIVIEAGQSAGHRWRTQSWDSLRLLTPNWMNDLAGAAYKGGASQGYMHVSEFAEQFDRAVASLCPPMHTNTRVRAVKPFGAGYSVETDQGMYLSRAVVLATGACAKPRVPAIAADLPMHLHQITSRSYKRAGDLPEGDILVVGASASGQQIARDLAQAGRNVTLAVGTHVRLPRCYRGQDIMSWLDVLGRLDTPYSEVDDLDRVRQTPSLTVIGSESGETLDLNALQDMGVRVAGRLSAIREGKLLFSGGLAALTSSADLKLQRLRAEIDAWIQAQGLDPLFPAPEPFEPTRLPNTPLLQTKANRMAAVIWATGSKPDHGWLKMPVFDRRSRLIHDGGYVAPGLIALGLPYMRTRRSNHIDGALRDAAALAPRLIQDLSQKHAA